MRLLAFISDAYGGRGGIAKHARDFLEASCAHPDLTEIVVLPRVAPASLPAAYPARLTFDTASLGGKWQYLREAFRIMRRGHYDAIICGHLHLLPISVAAATYHRVPLILVIYGLEAWKPRSPMTRHLLRRVNRVVTISEFTKDLFVAWSFYPEAAISVIPCGIDLSRYGIGAKRADLVAKHGLAGRTVLLTVGRIDAEDRYKGFDEVLNALPLLAEELPNATYLIVGDGPDRERLERRVAEMDLADRVVFAGWVTEEDKADYFRLADVYVMPGRGEGFGIVYLEAMACGIPTIASSVDASREAVRDGLLGQVVDPDNQGAIVRAVLTAIGTQRREVPPGLEYFSVQKFNERWVAMLRSVIANNGKS